MVSYYVYNPGRVNISLYDLVGKKIEVLMDENKSEGNYNLSLSEYYNQLHGVYILRYKDNTGIVSEKILF